MIVWCKGCVDVPVDETLPIYGKCIEPIIKTATDDVTNALLSIMGMSDIVFPEWPKSDNPGPGYVEHFKDCP